MISNDKLDQYVKTKDDKAKLTHFYHHKRLINVVIGIAERSCRKCKSMTIRRIQQGKKIKPVDFCVYCAKKHEGAFGLISKTLEVEEDDEE